MRFRFLFPAFLALAGCSGIVDPTFMPAGYTYLNEYYKSPPGTEAPGIGYSYTPVANAAVVQQWSLVSAELVDALESQLGLAAQPVHVEMLPKQNAFNASFDYALREELRARGYTLTTRKGGALILKPEAYMPEDVNVPVEVNAYNGDKETLVIPEHREQAHGFIVQITATRNGALLGEVKDNFNLPAYGYVRGEGQDKRAKAAGRTPVSAHPERTNAPDGMVNAPPPEDILAPAPAPEAVEEKEIIEEKVDAQ